MRACASAALAACVVLFCTARRFELEAAAPPSRLSAHPSARAAAAAAGHNGGGARKPDPATRAPRAPHLRRAAPETRVCVVTSGCDDDEAAGSGTPAPGCSTSGGGSSSNATTLRACIEWANAQNSGGSSGQRIEFAAGVTVVNPTRALPAITAPFTTIDGLAGMDMGMGWGMGQGMVHINGAAVTEDHESAGLVGPPRQGHRSMRVFRLVTIAARHALHHVLHFPRVCAGSACRLRAPPTLPHPLRPLVVHAATHGRTQETRGLSSPARSAALPACATHTPQRPPPHHHAHI